MEQNELNLLRADIDAIDCQLVELLNRRYQVVRAIGEYKRRHQLSVYDPAREQQLLARLDALNQGPMTPETLHNIYQEIMTGARLLEDQQL